MRLQFVATDLEAAAIRPLHGAQRLAYLWYAITRRAGVLLERRIIHVNGESVLASFYGGWLHSAATIETDGERVRAIYTIANPDKLRSCLAGNLALYRSRMRRARMGGSGDEARTPACAGRRLSVGAQAVQRTGAHGADVVHRRDQRLDSFRDRVSVSAGGYQPGSHNRQANV